MRWPEAGLQDAADVAGELLVEAKAAQRHDPEELR
jgi:hypothetical protein